MVSLFGNDDSSAMEKLSGAVQWRRKVTWLERMAVGDRQKGLLKVDRGLPLAIEERMKERRKMKEEEDGYSRHATISGGVWEIGERKKVKWGNVIRGF